MLKLFFVEFSGEFVKVQDGIMTDLNKLCLVSFFVVCFFFFCMSDILVCLDFMLMVCVCARLFQVSFPTASRGVRLFFVTR